MANEVYSIILANQFIKEFKKLPRQDQKRVRRAMNSMRKDPYQGRKVKGADIGKHRWRVGNLRIRYDIEEKQVLVLRVIKREDAYRKF